MARDVADVRVRVRSEVPVEGTTFDDMRLTVDSLQAEFHSFDTDIKQIVRDVDGHMEDKFERLTPPVVERLMEHIQNVRVFRSWRRRCRCCVFCPRGRARARRVGRHEQQLLSASSPRSEVSWAALAR